MNLRTEGQPLDSLWLLEPTKPANRTASVPLANSGGLDFPQISDTQRGLPFLCPLAVHGSTARNWTCRARSGAEIEILFFDFGKRGGILIIARFHLVQQGGKAVPHSGVAYNSIPGHVAIQLGQKGWQTLDQFLSLKRRKHPNRIFDFAGGTHRGKISTRRRPKQYKPYRFHPMNLPSPAFTACPKVRKCIL